MYLIIWSQLRPFWCDNIGKINTIKTRIDAVYDVVILRAGVRAHYSCDVAKI